MTRGRRVFLAILWALFSRGCAPSGPSGWSVSAGPEIRIELFHSSSALLRFGGEVEIVSLEDESVLYRGRLPDQVAARVAEGSIELGGRRVGRALRIVQLRPPPLGADATSRTAGGSPEGGGKIRSADPGNGEGTRPEGAVPESTRPVAATAVFEVRPRSEPGEPRRYRGALELHHAGDSLRVVNAVPLEDYLAGVIAGEMPALYPEEALKAQAVAARTYALYSLRLAEGRGESPIFPASAVFQVYGGAGAEHPRVGRALEATRGEVLAYEGKLFRAYFHSTCGGRTARGSLTFGEPDIPPLRGVVCGHCDGTRFARWECVLSRDLLETAVRRRLEREGRSPSVGKVTGLEVAEVGDDGYVRYVLLRHALGSFEWRSDLFQRDVRAIARGKVRSRDFRIEPAGDEGFRVIGRGWGHGLGLCQVGCGRMGRTAGYREILAHYYPESEVRKEY